MTSNPELVGTKVSIEACRHICNAYKKIRMLNQKQMENEIRSWCALTRASRRSTVQSWRGNFEEPHLGAGWFPIAAIFELSVGPRRSRLLHRRYMLTPCPFWSNDYRGLLGFVFRNRAFLFEWERRSSVQRDTVWPTRSRCENRKQRDCWWWQGLISRF